MGHLLDVLHALKDNGNQNNKAPKPKKYQEKAEKNSEAQQLEGDNKGHEES